MKIIFFGSDDLAAACLDRLIQDGHKVPACVTQPDRAKGRGLKISPLPVKACAASYHIPVFQPQDLRDQNFLKPLKNFESDLFVVIAYGRFLPVEVLEIPKICSLNVHASLLPKYRGAAPINWAIIRGEKETGVSVIRMNEKMDAGDILFQQRTAIDDQDTAVTLRRKLTELSRDCLLQAVALLEKKSTHFHPQDQGCVSFAPKLTKAMGRISWNQSAQEIHDLVRGLVPWPGAYTFYKKKLLKILETEIIPPTEDHICKSVDEHQGTTHVSAWGSIGGSAAPHGQVVKLTHSGFIVTTGKDSLLVKKVHLESSKVMDAVSFTAGHKLEAGYCFEVE